MSVINVEEDDSKLPQSSPRTPQQGLVNEVNLQKELADQATKKLKSELLELKDEKRKELEGIEGKLRTAEIERAEINAHMQSTRE